MINNLINNSSQAGIRIKEPHDTAVWAGFEILPFEIENLVHSGQQVTETRLTYNCAHLRLNNKKNKNKLSQSQVSDHFQRNTNFGEKFLGINFLV